VDWVAPGATARPRLRLRVGRLNAVLGTALDRDDVTRLLTPIGFTVHADGDGDRVDVVPPSFRPDATAEIDLIEEVARHHGYGTIALTTVRPSQVGRLNAHQRARRDLRDVLRGAGLNEAMGSPLLGPGDHPRAGLPESGIVAVDPLVREESLLRSSLLPGLLRAAAFNHDRRNGDLGLFEVGQVWQPGPADAPRFSGPDAAPGRGLPDEREVCAVLLAGAGPAGTGADAQAATQILWRLLAGLRVDGVTLEAGSAPGLHPTRSAAVRVPEGAIGWVGEVDPDVVAAWGLEGRVGWLQVEVVPLFAARRADEGARPVSRFPSSDVDLAFSVPDEVPAGAVRATLLEAGSPLAEWVRLFDVFRGPGVAAGQRSLAFRLRLSAQDHTLTDAERGEWRRRCIDAVERAHGAALRA
jgi:phenylalanyl-tRNA synthetase beta chain